MDIVNIIVALTIGCIGLSFCVYSINYCCFRYCIKNNTYPKDKAYQIESNYNNQQYIQQIPIQPTRSLYVQPVYIQPDASVSPMAATPMPKYY